MTRVGERDRRRGLFVFSCVDSVNQGKKTKQISQTLSLALSALKENILENACEEMIKYKLSNDLTEICFFVGSRRTGWGLRVLTSRRLSLISLLPYVSVGMQRVSSLRTQRVAGSSSECEAHKKWHD